MNPQETAVRRRILIVSGVLGFAAVAVLVVGLATRTDDQADEWRVVELTLPPSEGPNPQSPFTPHEQTILRHLRRGRPDPHSAYEVAIAKRREREFEEAGGNSPAAFPFYLRLLNWQPRIEESQEWAILRQVARTPGDRSAFRQPSVERLKHPKPAVVKQAILLLMEIGTPAEAAEVVKVIENYEADHPGQRLMTDITDLVLVALAVIGTEAEIQALEQTKARNFLWNNDKFWAKAEECKATIRKRLAKENEKADKK